ncbi:hypothetical protein [Erwinia psidii]|uniref:hypothetical protein n=1 Tax=Erwinia psidii TaxID=69224 RepID=UPI00226B2091|nr:hypothetical protein [Erwinia psidii]
MTKSVSARLSSSVYCPCRSVRIEKMEYVDPELTVGDKSLDYRIKGARLSDRL